MQSWALPGEVAHKILEEQARRLLCRPHPAPQGAFPLAHGAGRWAGGAGYLHLFLPVFQRLPRCSQWNLRHRQTAALVPEESSSTHLAVPADTVPLPIPADDLGESTLQIPLEKLRTELELELDYGSVVFVTDPTLTSDVYATFQFDNFPHTPLQRTSDEYGHTTLDFEMPDNWQVSPDAPVALLTVTLPADALTRLTLDLEVGDVHLDDLQLQSLKVELDNGSLYADDLTVTRDLEADISIGGCLIRQLSGTKQANISAYRSIHLCLDGDPADYTIDARTDNVVRIGSKKYDKRYTSTGPKGDLDLSATGPADLTSALPCLTAKTPFSHGLEPAEEGVTVLMKI